MIKNFKKNAFSYLKNSMLLKITISYILIVVILLSLFAKILFNSYSKESIKEINTICYEMVFQAYNTANTLLKSDFEYFFKMYNDNTKASNPIVFNALYSSKFDAIEMRDIHRLLNEAKSSHTIVNSIYIYNGEAGVFFSSLSPVCDAAEFYDKDIMRYINNPELVQNQRFVLRKTDLSSIRNEKDANLISVILGESSSGKMDSAFIVNFDQKVLQNILSNGNGKKKSQIMVVDRKGTVISHTDDGMFNLNLYEKPYIKTIISSKEPDGYFIDKINNKKYLITYIKSMNWSQLDWNFISIGEYKDLISRLTLLRKNILLLTLVFMLFGIIIASVFGRSIYKPIYNLVNKVKQKNKNMKSNGKYYNEYGYLNDAFDNMFGDISEMKNSMRSYMPKAKKNILRMILNGDFVSLDEMKENIEVCKINIISPYFIVCVFSIDSYANLCLTNSNEDISLLRFAVSNIACEILNSTLTAEIVDGDNDNIVAIIGLNEHSTSKIKALNELITKMQQAVQLYLKFTVTVSVGDVAEGLEEIQYSFKQALECSKYRLTHGRNSLLEYNKLKEKCEGNVYRYPFELEKQIMDAFRLSKKDKLKDLVDDFAMEVEKCSYEEVLLSFTQLAVMSVRIAGSMINLEKEKMDVSYNSFSKIANESETMNDIKEWLCQFYNAVIDRVSEKKEGKNENIVNRIYKYVEEKYRCSDLTVDSISDYVQLSPNYLRIVFKDVTRKSLSNYIMDFRLQKAIELMNTTDIPAIKIAEMIGFADSGYFYVAFKKHMGKTPDQFRKSS